MELCDSNVSLPPNWIKKGSKSHPDKFYYHNIVTKKSVWKLSELPMQKTNNDKSKVITPNKQLTSISHGSKAIKRNIAEDRLKSLKKGLSKEVANNIKNDHKILTQNTSERPRSIKKHNTKSSLPRHSFSPMSVARKNLAQQRMKNLTSSFSFESKQLESTSSIKRKLDMSPNIDIFSAKRLTTSSVNPDMFTPNRSVTLKTSNNGSFTSSRSLTSHNFNDSFTPKRSLTKNKDTDNSARKILKSSRKSSTVQDRLIINNDVFMLDVSSDITTEEMDDKMDWEEIPVQKIVEKVQNVRNNPNISLMSSNDQVRKSHRNVNHSEDHFYCVIDTNVLLSNLDTIKNMEGTIYHNIGKAVVYVPYIVLNELDKIKTLKDNVAKLARIAIGVINENLKIRNTYFCAQSAREQMKIIEIKSGDDLILNACLQINNITPKVLLISNDINLRNKAHANQISCMSGIELIRAKNNSSNEITFQ